jgi:hypothetical protein
VIASAVNALKNEKWEGVWGADADHLQTTDDAIQMVKHGYSLFTIDSSEYIDNQVDHLNEEALYKKYYDLNQNDTIRGDDIYQQYLGKTYELGDDIILSFYDKVILIRAILKYIRAINHMSTMYQCIKNSCTGKKYEVEISIDETLKPTSPLEHLFISLELKRNNVKFISIAPRFIGDFEKGIDYKGDIKAFEKDYKKHVAIAHFCGPYKISIHSGSDKFSIYPIIGRLSGNLLHVKTAGTSYLEALRVVCRTDKKLFYEIISLAREKYNTDKQSYHVSANLSDIPEKMNSNQLEEWYLNNNSGRQILHVTYGSVLAGSKGKSILKEKIMENLAKNSDLHKECLYKHFTKHINLLST